MYVNIDSAFVNAEFKIIKLECVRFIKSHVIVLKHLTLISN